MALIPSKDKSRTLDTLAVPVCSDKTAFAQRVAYSGPFTIDPPESLS